MYSLLYFNYTSMKKFLKKKQRYGKANRNVLQYKKSSKQKEKYQLQNKVCSEVLGYFYLFILIFNF